jgi:predicted  nucleic acid-binding Zn-ribbon protein
MLAVAGIAGLGLVAPWLRERKVKMGRLERTLMDLVSQLLELVGALEEENDKLSERPTKEYTASTEKKLKSLELDYTALQGELKAARDLIGTMQTGTKTLQDEIMALRGSKRGKKRRPYERT